MNTSAKISLGVATAVAVYYFVIKNNNNDTPQNPPPFTPPPTPKVEPKPITIIEPQQRPVGNNLYFNNLANSAPVLTYKSTVDYVTDKPYFSLPAGRKTSNPIRLIGSTIVKKRGISTQLYLVRIPGVSNDLFVESIFFNPTK